MLDVASDAHISSRAHLCSNSLDILLFTTEMSIFLNDAIPADPGVPAFFDAYMDAILTESSSFNMP